MRVERDLDPGAGGETEVPTVVGCGVAHHRHGGSRVQSGDGIEVAPGRTGGDVDQGPVKGQAGTCAQRIDRVHHERRSSGLAALVQCKIAGSVRVGPVDVALDAEHGRPPLLFVTSLNAECGKGALIGGVGVGQAVRIEELAVGISAARIGADVETGPACGRRQARCSGRRRYDGVGVESSARAVRSARNRRSSCGKLLRLSRIARYRAATFRNFKVSFLSAGEARLCYRIQYDAAKEGRM